MNLRIQSSLPEKVEEDQGPEQAGPLRLQTVDDEKIGIFPAKLRFLQIRSFKGPSLP